MSLSFKELDQLVIDFAGENGLLEKSVTTMLDKASGDLQRLTSAIRKGKQNLIVEELGEIVMTLIVISEIANHDLTECLEHTLTYCKTSLKRRTGSLRNL